jgi:hypothetical protein
LIIVSLVAGFSFRGGSAIILAVATATTHPSRIV